MEAPQSAQAWDMVQWILNVGLPAVIAWVTTKYTLWQRERKMRKAIRRLIKGLPPDARATIQQFKSAGTHTITLNPSDNIVRYLERLGLIFHSGDGDGYAAVNGLYTLRVDIFELL